MHVYRNGWNSFQNRWLAAEDVNTCERHGRKCIIGEFSLLEFDGEADVPGVMKRAQELHLPICAWAWNGDGIAGGLNFNLVKPNWVDSPLETEVVESLPGREILEFMDRNSGKLNICFS